MVKKNKGRRNRHATRNNNNNNHVLKGVNNETVKINPNNNSSNNTGNTTVESSIDTIQRDNNIGTLDSNSNLSTTTSNTDNNVSNMVHQEAGQEEVNSSLASLVNNSSNLGSTLVNPQNIIEQSESGDSNSDIYSDTNNVTDDANNVTNDTTESAEDVDFSTVDDSNTMLVDNNDSGAVKILDKIVTYEMVGWWDDAEDKPYSRLRLHQKSPVIKFKQHITGDTDGDNDTEVSIVVTRQLASQLATLFEAVQDSYDGKPVSDKHKKVKNWAYFVEYWKQMWKYNPVKVVFGTILTLVVLGSLIYVSFH